MGELAPVLQASRRVDGYLPIEDYAAIGDGRSLALVGSDGSIDWMCLPELDSPSVFGALLDRTDGGSFSLEPELPYELQRSYLKSTNVLCSELRTREGTVRVTEALTLDSGQSAPWRELVRRVEGLSGAVPMRWRLRPRFDFGRHSSDPVRVEETHLFRWGELQLALRCFDAGEPQPSAGELSGSFRLEAGEQAMLALIAGDRVSLPAPTREAIERRLEATVRLWREWLAHLDYEGPWREEVERSLLALRLLADGRTGAIAAAGTSSLPEALGGQRNYDYRFGWVRDLSFTVDALLRVGMDQLAHSSIDWLLESLARTQPRVDPVYSLTGEVVRSQRQLPLSGYRGTTPVNLGNQAGSQLQLGGFGDLLETLWRYAEHGHLLAPRAGERIADSVDLMCALWRHPDAGLWELGDYAQYTTSKLSCWTALERLLALVQRGQAPARHLTRWQRERESIREFIETRLYSPQRRCYVMKEGSEMLDCGVLLASRRGYGDPKGERINATIDAIRSELHAEGALFYRYSGMEEQENAFLACSFWVVEALALAGRTEEAGELMDGAVALAGPLGLLSEEMEPGSRARRGNFPQALTHLALITAAAVLHRESRR
jgi:GH15 family glucan-1,4-alpha-glucosidase